MTDERNERRAEQEEDLVVPADEAEEIKGGAEGDPDSATASRTDPYKPFNFRIGSSP